MDVVTVIKRSPVVFPLACIAAVALVLISEGSYWQSINGLQDLTTGRDARERVLGLERSLLDAETGQRGYLLTQNKDYLVPYDAEIANIDAAFKALETFYQDGPAERAVLRQLHTAAGAKLSELALTIRMQNDGRTAAVTDLLRSNIGKEQMEEVRALSGKLLSLSAVSLVETRLALRRTLMLSRTGMALLAALSLLSLYLYLRHTTQHELHQRELQRLIQSERDGLQTEVALRTAELSELTKHLLTAREDERARLARDLHDELGALLTSAKLDAARIRSRLAGTAPEALDRLAHLVETLNSSIALGRRIIEDLRPSTLSNLGLVAALDILAREFTEQSGIEVVCALSPVQLDPATELVVYRVVQEAITNISKYAKAHQVWLDLGQVGKTVRVSVRDDGVGFDSTRKVSSTFGLVGMRFRVEAEGGTLQLTTAPGQGTRLQVTLPSATPAPAPPPAPA